VAGDVEEKKTGHCVGGKVGSLSPKSKKNGALRLAKWDWDSI